MFFGTDLSAGDALCDSAAGIAPYAAAFGERVHHALERQLAAVGHCCGGVGVCSEYDYGRYSVYEEPLYTAALIYLLMTTFLGWIFLRLEKRYNPQHR